MKILYVTPYPPIKSGIAEYAFHFRTSVEAHTALCMDVIDPLIGPGDSITSMEQAVHVLSDQIETLADYDLIHVECGYSGARELFLGLGIRKLFPHKPMVVTAHDPPILVRHLSQNVESNRAIHRVIDLLRVQYIERTFIQNLDKIFVLSRRGTKLFSAFHPLSQKKTIFLPFMNYPPLGGESAYGQTKIHITFLGFISPNRGLETLIDAYKKLVQDPYYRDTTELWICGMGLGKNSYVDSLQERCSYLIDDGNIVFKGYVENQLLGELLTKTDIFVIPHIKFRLAPFSGTLMRAMCEGKAIVATHANSPGEVIVNRETGLLVPPKDADALCQSIKQLIDDPNLRLRLGKNARDYVNNTHNRECIASQYALTISRILGEIDAHRS